ncbi:MAG: EAL domain-containing protein [Methylococcaceae bacterium]|jgi:diguanylate cyclase (GGDEF)-like protein
MTLPHPVSELSSRLIRVERRLDRERRARIEAEQLLEEKSLALYEANLALGNLAEDLEIRVEERTRELITARQLALKQAETDALTNIANRAAFTRQLDEILADKQATLAGIAVFLIDLDDFKIVNDTLGHPVGDALLIEISQRLTLLVRPGDMVARLGGDEFAVIALNVGFKNHGLMMAQRILNQLCRPLRLTNKEVPCSCSIGLAEAEPEGTRADKLLVDADLALYASKHAGRGRVTSYEATLRAEMEKRAVLENEVRYAVIADEIRAWYQPIWDCSVGKFKSIELLARWHTSTDEIKLPGIFLATVEELGLLDTMMENMLRRAFVEVMPLMTSGVLDYLTINVSPMQFNHGWTQYALPKLLAETGFPATALVVELTETAVIYDIEKTRAMFSTLLADGIRIAIDDFGVGYSNFSILRQLPFYLLKLDRTLTADIEMDETSRAVNECILALASRLNIQVVAEGVETQRQSDYLSSIGCYTQQGYLYAYPCHMDQLNSLFC